MMDSMTKMELDRVEPLTETSILRITRSAGTNPKEPLFLPGKHTKFAK
jgi:signal recognition particle GTPase